MPRDPADWRRLPGQGDYARTEVERRFLVHDDPPVGAAERLVEDRYLDGTNLRLRRVTADGERVHKLTQKVRPDPADPSTVLITNTYLDEGSTGGCSLCPAATSSRRGPSSRRGSSSTRSTAGGRVCA